MDQTGLLNAPAADAIDSAPPSRRWMRFRVLLVVLVICRGLVLLCVLPPFEGWDEYQHVAYVQHLREHGTAPRFGTSTVSPALLSRVAEFPQPRLALPAQLERLGAKGYWRFWEESGVTTRPAPTDARLQLYQAQHSSLYYRLAEPLYAALGGASELRASVSGLRFLNLLFVAAAVWITLGAVRRSVRRERDAALFGLLLAVHPLFLMNGVRVANDALGVLLAAMGIAACLSLGRVTSSRRMVATCLGVGLLIGLAILSKATNFALVPFAFLGVVVLAWQRGGPRLALPATLALGAGTLLVVSPDVASNLANFGSLTPMQEAVFNRNAGRTAVDLVRTAASLDWPGWIQRLWDRELLFVGGWSFRPAGYIETLAYRQLIAAGILGWLWILAARLVRGRRTSAATFRSGGPPLAALVLVLSYTLALGYHRVQSHLAWGASSTCPWYASPALPWFLLLVVGGALSWPGGRRLGPPLALGLSLVCLATEVIGVFGRMVPWYTAFAPWPIALERLAWGQPLWLGSPTLVLAMLAQVVVLALLAMTWRDAIRDDRRAAGPVVDDPSIRLDRGTRIARIAPRMRPLGRRLRQIPRG